MKRKNRFSGRPRELRHQKNKTISLEADLEMEFDELCTKEGMTFSEKIREMMTEELEKNAAGLVNPINISYDKNKNLSWLERMPNPEEINKLKEDIRTYSNPKILERIEAMGITLRETSRARQKEITFRK